MNHFPSNTLFKSINKTNPSSQQQHNSQHNKISGPSLLCSPLSTTPHQTLLPNPNFQEHPLHLFHPNPFKLTAPHIFTSFPTGFSKQSDCHFYPYAFLKAMNFRSLEEFWAFYVNQHSKPSTRRWHFVGTLFGIFFLICSVFFSWWLLFFVPFSGYGCAWYSHFFVEGNVPATFGHPFWSLLCDFKMFGLMLTGKMDREIKRLGKRPVLQVF